MQGSPLVRRLSRCATAIVLAALIAPTAAPARLTAVKGFGPGDGHVVIAGSDGRHVHRLAQGDSAQISPNGKWVAILDADPGQQNFHPRLKVYRARGGKPLFVIRRGYGPLSWSADSTKLVGAETKGFSTIAHLVVIDARTGKRTTFLKGDLSSTTFSPDGSQVAYIRYDLGGNIGGTLQVIDLGSRVVRTLADRVGGLTWGPNEIAFTTLSSNSYRFSNIAAIKPDGTGLRRLTNVAPRKTSGFYPVDWSADGRRLLAGYYDQGIPRTYAIDPINGGVRLIARRVAPAALSRDGRTVIGETGNPFCCSNDPINVVRVPWNGGKPHVLIGKAFGASSSD
jgi:WD40 repeat protein